MVKMISPKILFLIAVTALFAVAAVAQEGPPPNRPQDAAFGPPGKGGPPPDDMRPNILEELGLSREQFQAVRRLNADRKPLEQAARERFQNANRSLNAAIYADNVDDADFRTRLSEFQSAQAELARLKFNNELAIRKLLTPAQLVRFRELRRRFAEARQNDARDVPPVSPPFRQLRRGNRVPGN